MGFFAPPTHGEYARNATFLVAATVFGVVSSVVTGDDKPQFKITTKQDTDKVEVKAEKDRTLISVHSPVGISNVVIERIEGKWSEAVMLRLHLRGLERLHVSSSKVTLTAAVSSQDSQQRLWKDGNEKFLLDTKSPLWVDIRVVGGDGKPTKTIPLKDGYFEMVLPKVLFADNPKSIGLEWIDFYRN